MEQMTGLKMIASFTLTSPSQYPYSNTQSQLARHLLPAAGIICIGRGVLFPKFDKVDTIEKMSIVRSDVGVAWVLYSATMESARIVVETVRQMQQLVSEVERVTDLMELLERVKLNKAEELASAVTTGDCIEFSHVDIYTPADVLLVKDLTFKLERGQSLLLTGHNGCARSNVRQLCSISETVLRIY
jgi:ABC-type uncharacterized transport system fused permease/ATPase subunit